MTVALVMMARDEEKVLPRALGSAAGLVDSWMLLDTGSSDRTPEIAAEIFQDIPGRVVQTEWEGFGAGRTRALAEARDQADWLLMLDADQTVTFHEDLSEWLAGDPDPEVGVWTVPVEEGGTTWWMPRLTRGGLEWRYEGTTHEWLDFAGRRSRQILGLSIKHHADGFHRPEKHLEDIRLLEPGVEANDPRAVYYTAQALACLGRTHEAAALYRKRAEMNGWEEERWHAQYMAARLERDVEGLLRAHTLRPWRHEPLTWASRFVAEAGTGEDVLFLEARDG
jgi:hypothetical protein